MRLIWRVEFIFIVCRLAKYTAGKLVYLRKHRNLSYCDRIVVKDISRIEESQSVYRLGFFFGRSSVVPLIPQKTRALKNAKTAVF